MKFDKEYFDGRGSVYKFGYGRLNKFYFWSYYLRNILKFKSSGKLLDIGCAYGYFLKYTSKYFDCYGIDVSKHAINRAKAEVKNAKFFCSSIEDFSSPNIKFDVITAFFLLEHCKNFNKLLKKIKSLLKRNGIFVFTITFLTKSKFNRTWAHIDDSHISLFSEKELCKRVKKYFKIVDKRYLVPFPFFKIWPFSSGKSKNFFTTDCLFVCKK